MFLVIHRQDDIPIEIDANYGGKPLHILLGDDNICYEAAGKNVRNIKNGELVFNRILEVIK